MKKIAEFKINRGEDRDNMVIALNVAGYCTTIEERKLKPWAKDYWVIVYEGKEVEK